MAHNPYFKTPHPTTGEVAAIPSPMTPIPAGDNPFRHDSFNMGSNLVRGWMVMYPGFDNEEKPLSLPYVILVNTRTGQRIRIDMVVADREFWDILDFYPGRDTLVGAKKGLFSLLYNETDRSMTYTNLIPEGEGKLPSEVVVDPEEIYVGLGKTFVRLSVFLNLEKLQEAWSSQTFYDDFDVDLYQQHLREVVAWYN